MGEDFFRELKILQELKDSQFDLIYIDPPFFTERKLSAKVQKHNRTANNSSQNERSFDDRWESLSHYVDWLRIRLLEMKRLLKPTGNIVVHLDHHAVHYIKVAMDEIFGIENFQNEIIWSYRTGGASQKRFAAKHDNLLWYSNDPKKYFYNCIKERVYYQKPFFNPLVDEQGRYYADVIPVDTWEIKAVINISKERVDYPTQKPEELMAKLVRALCPEGGRIADFFLGGGTTIAVAEKLKRSWFGCDVSEDSIKTTEKRLKNLNSGFGIKNEWNESHRVEYQVIRSKKTSKQEQLSA